MSTYAELRAEHKVACDELCEAKYRLNRAGCRASNLPLGEKSPEYLAIEAEVVAKTRICEEIFQRVMAAM